MRIIINDKYAIGSDQYSFHILRGTKRKRSGRQATEWTPCKWFTSLEGLINGFAEYQIRMSNAETLTELLKFKKDLIAELRGRLQAEFRKVA